MRGHSQSHKGIYNPQRKEKYKGTLPIIWRSSLELKFFRWCDRNDRVLQWGSESVVVPYINPKDGKVHRYFVDSVLIMKTDTGNKKFLIEIKPDSQTRAPLLNSRMSMKNKLYAQGNWAVNSSKWESARNWCQKNGFEFVLITEKDLK